jgi:hypothetical protein
MIFIFQGFKEGEQIPVEFVGISHKVITHKDNSDSAGQNGKQFFVTEQIDGQYY